MLTFSRTNLLARYLTSGLNGVCYLPRTLCAVFWTTVFKIFADTIVFIGLPGILLFMTYQNPLAIGVSIGIILFACAIGATIDYIKHSDGVVAQGIKGIKHKFCPLVKWE